MCTLDDQTLLNKMWMS